MANIASTSATKRSSAGKTRPALIDTERTITAGEKTAVQEAASQFVLRSRIVEQMCTWTLTQRLATMNAMLTRCAELMLTAGVSSEVCNAVELFQFGMRLQMSSKVRRLSASLPSTRTRASSILIEFMQWIAIQTLIIRFAATVTTATLNLGKGTAVESSNIKIWTRLTPLRTTTKALELTAFRLIRTEQIWLSGRWTWTFNATRLSQESCLKESLP